MDSSILMRLTVNQLRRNSGRNPMLCRTIERHFNCAEKISFTSHYGKGAFAHGWSPERRLRKAPSRPLWTSPTQSPSRLSSAPKGHDKPAQGRAQRRQPRSAALGLNGWNGPSPERAKQESSKPLFRPGASVNWWGADNQWSTRRHGEGQKNQRFRLSRTPGEEPSRWRLPDHRSMMQGRFGLS